MSAAQDRRVASRKGKDSEMTKRQRDPRRATACWSCSWQPTPPSSSPACRPRHNHRDPAGGRLAVDAGPGTRGSATPLVPIRIAPDSPAASTSTQSTTPPPAERAATDERVRLRNHGELPVRVVGEAKPFPGRRRDGRLPDPSGERGEPTRAFAPGNKDRTPHPQVDAVQFTNAIRALAIGGHEVADAQ
jgi:hypothetical protein